MGIATKIVFYALPIILLIVVLVIFFGEAGAWEELKDNVMTVKEYLPDIGFGLEEVTAGEAEIPPEQKEALLGLNTSINSLRGKANCTVKYKSFPDLGETLFEIKLKGENSVLTTVGGPGGKWKITDLRFEFPGMRPCVIAGHSSITENFYNHFLQRERAIIPYFRPVNSIKIAFEEGITRYDGNVIRVSDFDQDIVNDEGDNLEDGGYIFTPDGVHFCFFPTNKINNHDKDGMDNDYFTSGGSNSIQKIPTCQN